MCGVGGETPEGGVRIRRVQLEAARRGFASSGYWDRRAERRFGSLLRPCPARRAPRPIVADVDRKHVARTRSRERRNL